MSDTVKKKPPHKLSGPTDRPAAKTLDEAILNVMDECPYILKTGQVGKGAYAYSYAGDADLIEVLRPSMLRHGLTLVPSRVKLAYNEQYPSENGKVWNRVAIIVRFRMCHAVSGQIIFVETMGEGCDMGDKGASKAMTNAHKYALKEAFNIQTGDDPDRVASEEQARGPAVKEVARTKEDTFAAAKTAVMGAATVTILERFRNAYKGPERGYTAEQIKELDGLYSARLQGLKANAEKSREAAARN